MKLNTLGPIFSSLAALQTFSDAFPHESRATDGVWICSDKDWKEPCGWVPAWESDTLCRGFPYPLSAYLSLGPDSGVTCTVFTDEHCVTANDGTDSKDVSFPGNPMLPGPAYQGGQGTAHSPAYHAYKCHARSIKREITSIERMQDLGKSEDTQFNEESKVEKRDSQTRKRDPSGLLPLDGDSDSLPLRPTHSYDWDGVTDGLWMCSRANWGGTCKWTPVPEPISCAFLPLDWNEFSFSPDRGITCSLYTNLHCKTDLIEGLEMNYPGYPRMAGPSYSGGGDHDREFAYGCWPTGQTVRRGETGAIDGGANSSETEVANTRALEVKVRTANPRKAGGIALLATSSPLRPRANDGVYVCSEREWKDDRSWTKIIDPNTCYPVPGDWGMFSFGPDRDVTCMLHPTAKCDTSESSALFPVDFPGMLTVYGPSYYVARGASHVKAYRCEREGVKREVGIKIGSNDYDVTSDTSSRVSEANTQSGISHHEGSLFPLATSNPLESRAANGVLICPEAGWKGQCVWTQVGMSPDCRPVPSGWERWPLDPDIDVTCFLYADTQCKSESYTIRTQTNWPGLDKLAGPAYSIGKRDTSVTACKAYACNKREADNPKPDPSNGVHAPNFQVPEANVRAIEPRGKGSLYICELPYWQGTCQLWSVEATEEIQAPCVAFPYPTSSTAVSFGPDPGVVCKIYVDDECFGENMPHVPEIIFPGWTDLEKHGSNPGPGWARYKCWQGDCSKVATTSTEILI